MAGRSPAPFTPTQERVGHVVIRAMSAVNVWLYRLSGGRVGGRFRHGAPVLLLTTVGRKTGASRVAPLLYLEDGDNLVIVASKGGMSHHPTWYLNVQAHPDVEVEVGSERRNMRARTADAAERSALWPRLVEMYRDYDDYQARTERVIPVVILSPRPA
ncbi:MAG: nitroreductase family deazaflavin-dependent oxidoreductase [Deltaproteobacteria bacterium]|nr:nitroreductase family deazaflavin-dependent oxidoreductase [Deltaproteobacteria bacterium]